MASQWATTKILVCLAGILVGCSSEASPALRGAESMNETAVVPQVVESQTAEASVDEQAAVPCVQDAHCQMTGDSECKCTYNGGSTFEDPCRCGAVLEDPHCRMSGSVCKCTYNGGSTIEDSRKCGVAPVNELDGATSFDSGFVVAAEEAANVESLSAMGSACTSGVVGQVYAMAPACLDACSGSCGALGGAINAYLKQGGSPAAKKYVCSHKSSFYCPVTGSAKGKCAGLISKAASFGFHLPSSVGALNAECR